jgi:phage terminase large subunit-like protein
LIVGLSTAGDDPDSILSRLTEYGRDHPNDPAFYFREFTAPVLDDHLDESTWSAANPGLDDFVSRDHLRATAKTTRPDVFRRFHLNQAVGAVGAWLPFGAFEACADRDRIVLPGEKIVAGWDGSLGGDASVLIGCTVEDRPHLFVIGWWERNIERKKDPDWKVPRSEVNAAVASMFDVFDIVELAADPFFWRSEIEQWAEQWPGKVIQWPTNQPRRTAPGTERLFVATMERTFTHDGDPRLIAHARNAKARRTSHGDVLNKRSESKRIDGIIASLVAFDRAAFHRGKAQKRRAIYAF